MSGLSFPSKIFHTLFLPLRDQVSRLEPLVLLFIRGWIGWVFFRSGQLKLEAWDSTLYLFQYEYAVPLLPPNFAAWAATATELACPILLWLGLGTRLAALPLLVMTGVIEWTYQTSPEHEVWALFLALLITRGGGTLSLDAQAHIFAPWLKKTAKS